MDTEELRTNVKLICEQIVGVYKPQIERAHQRGDSEKLSALTAQMRNDLRMAQEPLVRLAMLTPPEPVILPHSALDPMHLPPLSAA